MLNKAFASRNLRLPQPYEDGDHVPEPLVVAETLPEPDVLALKELLDTTTIEKSSIAATSSSSLRGEAVNHDTIEISPPSRHSSPPISSLKPTGLPIKYFIRIDRGGSFHTYPLLGGPFQSLQEAQNAINDQHADQRKIMCMDGLSRMEIKVRRALYWPDGTRRNSAEALAAMKHRKPGRELVQALLDKYSEDNNLLGDLAYELIEIVHEKAIPERKGSPYRVYYHLNLTIKTKGADDSHCGIDSLFFAEVTHMDGEHEEFVLSCICMVKPNDNGQCYGCTGCVDMKHPSDAEYKRGHSNTPLPCMGSDEGVRAHVEELIAVYDEAKLKAEEARVRLKFKDLYNPGFARVHKDYPNADRGDGQRRRNKYVVPARR